MPSEGSLALKAGLKGAYASASVQARGGWRKVSHPTRSTSTSHQISTSSSRDDTASRQPKDKQVDDSNDDVVVDSQGYPPHLLSNNEEIRDELSVSVPARAKSLHISSDTPPSSVAPQGLQVTSRRPQQDNQGSTPRHISASGSVNRWLPRQSTPLVPSATPFPSLQARCEILAAKAQAVIKYYADWFEWWRDEGYYLEIYINAQTVSEMLKFWEPFQEYKTSHLFPGSQFHHHFILIEEHASLLLPKGSTILPAGVEDALRLANFATFVHYLRHMPIEDLPETDCELWEFRSLAELEDARRVFWRVIVPAPQIESGDLEPGLLNYSRISVILFCARLEALDKKVKDGLTTARAAKVEVRANMDELLGVNAIRDVLMKANIGGKKAQDAARYWSECCALALEKIRKLEGLDSFEIRFHCEMGDDSACLQMWINELAETAAESLIHLQQPSHAHTIDTKSSPASLQSPAIQSQVWPRAESRSESISSQEPGWLKDLIAGKREADTATSIGGYSEITEETQLSMSNSQVMRVLTRTEREAALVEMFSQSQRTSSAAEDGDSDVTETGHRNSGDYLIHDERADKSASGDDLSMDFSVRNGKILHGASEERRRAKATNSGAIQMHAKSAEAGPSSVRSLGSQLEIRSGRIQRLPPAQRLDLFRPTGKGVRLTRFNSQSISSVSYDLASAVVVRSPHSDARKRTVTIKTPPFPRRTSIEQIDSRPGPSIASLSHRSSPGGVSNTIFMGVFVEEPSDQLKQAFRAHLKASALLPKRLTRAAARRQGEERKAITQTEQSMDRMTVTRNEERDERAHTVDAVLPAMPIERPAEGRELLPPQAVEADANHFDNLGAFEGDHDPMVREARKQLTLEYWFTRVRPGFEHFSRPARTSPGPSTVSQERAAHRDAVLLPGSLDIEPRHPSEAANQSSQLVGVVIESIDDIAQYSSPGAVGERRSQRIRQTRRSPSGQSGRQRQRGTQASPDEIDLIFSPEASALPPASALAPAATATDSPQTAGKTGSGRPKGSGARVRRPWTAEESKCLLDGMYKLARNKRHRQNYQVYAEILSRHGSIGSDDTVLKDRDNADLKAKVRLELLRMAREGEVLPYWKSLYWDSLFQTKEGKVALRAGEQAESRRTTHRIEAQRARGGVERGVGDDQEFEDALMRDVFNARSEHAGSGEDERDQRHEGEDIAIESDDAIEPYQLDDDGENDEGGESASTRSSPQTSVEELELEPDLQSQQTPTAAPRMSRGTFEDYGHPHRTPPPSARRTPPPSALRSPHQPRNSRAGSHVHFEDNEEGPNSPGRSQNRTTATITDEVLRTYPRSQSPSLRDRLTVGPVQILKRGRDLVRGLSLGAPQRDEEPQSSRRSLPLSRVMSDEEEASPRKRLRS